MRYLMLLTGLIFAIATWAAATRTIEGDQIRSSDKIKLWSFPASGDTLAGIAATQTLTNKTIVGANNTLTVRISEDTTGTLGLLRGGTGTAATSAADAFDALSPTTTTGDFIYHNGTDNVRRAIGSNGQFLKVSSDGTPAYAWSEKVTFPSTNYTISTDITTAITDTSLYGGLTITLPTASGNDGKIVRIVNLGSISNSDNVTVSGDVTGSYLVNGVNASYTGVATGGSWITLNKSIGNPVTAGNIKQTTTGIKTPTGSNWYHSLTSNSLALTQGVWRLSCIMFFSNGGASPSFNAVGSGYYRANGADSGVAPTALSGGAVTVNSAYAGQLTFRNVGNVDNEISTLPTATISVTSAGVTVYCVPYSSAVTNSNARIVGYFTAERIY